MTKKNFLLGKGERLTEDIIRRSGGGPKEAPYTFEEARARLTPMISKASHVIDNLPSAACPRDQAVVSLTLNPEYIAKSYFPLGLLNKIDVEVVGSISKKIVPQKRSRGRETTETVTTELFARGSRSAIRSWGNSIQDWVETDKISKELAYIEKVSAHVPENKIKGTFTGTGHLPMEVVLHATELEAQTHLLREFEAYLHNCSVDVNFGKRFFAKGLCFLEIDAPVARAEDIALFSMVRALRQMPDLRVLRPIIRSSGLPATAPQLPFGPPVSSDIRVAVFDGGIPEDHPIREWVSCREPADMRPTTEELVSHGVAVTSAALFGHIDPTEQMPQPYSFIDHYRVLDDDPAQNPYELYEVLDRIDGVLSSEEYDFVNLSLGPQLPIDDDDVHAWTAVLDDRLSRTSTLAVVAVGNDGEGDSLLGLDRVQVPADCVNALSVGSCNTPGDNWNRAPYSSVGPGRSPGRIKPDLVDFGGAIERPFVVLSSDATPTLTTTGGTSFATPSVARMAIGVRAHFGTNLNHLAIRTLLIHTAEESELDHKEVGWGRVARNISDIVLCDDDTIRVVYQGEISPAKYIRAPIPLLFDKINGIVTIKATICYKCQTDPHHPGNYTRAGLEVTFRPHDQKFTRPNQMHPDSSNFFGTCGTGSTEDELRRDAWKWENCLHAKLRKRGSSLRNPCFDIHYNSRLEGRNFTPEDKLPYALVITVQAKSVTDLYDQIVRKYATHIEPILPILEIPVRT